MDDLLTWFTAQLDATEARAHWDPARALRWVAATRRVVAAHRQVDGQGYTDTGYDIMPSVCATCGTFDEYGVPWPCNTLRALASVFSDQPGWREEWE